MPFDEPLAEIEIKLLAYISISLAELPFEFDVEIPITELVELIFIVLDIAFVFLL